MPNSAVNEEEGMDMNTEEVDEAEGFADAKELESVVQHHEGKQEFLIFLFFTFPLLLATESW